MEVPGQIIRKVTTTEATGTGVETDDDDEPPALSADAERLRCADAAGTAADAANHADGLRDSPVSEPHAKNELYHEFISENEDEALIAAAIAVKLKNG